METLSIDSPIPIKNGYELRDYQKESIQKIRENENKGGGSILNLDMGMGKTLVALAYAFKYKNSDFPTLVICSKAVMAEWKLEGFEKFFPGTKVLYYHKEYIKKSGFDSVNRETILQYDFVVTTYSVVTQVARINDAFRECAVIGEDWNNKGKIIDMANRTRDQADDPAITGPLVLYYTPWGRVIADESHAFSNFRTMLFRSMMNIYGDHKICLTGTPVRNNRMELDTQMKFLGLDRRQRSMWVYGKGCPWVVHMKYNPNTIVIPGKKLIDCTYKLDGMELEMYNYVCGMLQRALDQFLAGQLQFSNVLAIFTRLRQTCIAPFITTTGADGVLKPSTEFGTWLTDEEGTAGKKSMKIQKIVEIVKTIPKNEKVLIFSSFTRALRLIRNAVEDSLPDVVTEQMDGTTPLCERNDILKKFRENDDPQVLFLSYKVGSEGLNLARANHVICVEPWWTFATVRQAVARAWRSGQTREVNVYSVHAKDSIEDRVVELCDLKRQIANMCIDGGSTNIKPTLNATTLQKILG